MVARQRLKGKFALNGAMAKLCDDANSALLGLNISRVRRLTALRTSCNIIDRVVERRTILSLIDDNVESLLRVWEALKTDLGEVGLNVEGHLSDGPDVDNLCRDADASWLVWRVSGRHTRNVVEATYTVRKAMRRALRAEFRTSEERFQAAKNVQVALLKKGQRMRDQAGTRTDQGRLK